MPLPDSPGADALHARHLPAVPSAARTGAALCLPGGVHAPRSPKNLSRQEQGYAVPMLKPWDGGCWVHKQKAVGCCGEALQVASASGLYIIRGPGRRPNRLTTWGGGRPHHIVC